MCVHALVSTRMHSRMSTVDASPGVTNALFDTFTGWLQTHSHKPLPEALQKLTEVVEELVSAFNCSARESSTMKH